MTDRPLHFPTKHGTETLHMPLRNCKNLGPLAPVDELWWYYFSEYYAKRGK